MNKILNIDVHLSVNYSSTRIANAIRKTNVTETSSFAFENHLGSVCGQKYWDALCPSLSVDGY